MRDGLSESRAVRLRRLPDHGLPRLIRADRGEPPRVDRLWSPMDGPRHHARPPHLTGGARDLPARSSPLALVLIAACGVFVAAEFSFVTVDRAQVDQDGGRRRPRRAGAATRAAQPLDAAVRRPGRHHGHQPRDRLPRRTRRRRPDRRAARPARRARRERSRRSPPTIGLLLGTFLTMIFGELVPKNLALALPMETARATQRFQRSFTAVMRVPIRLLNGSANAVVRRLGLEPQEELRSARSSTELASLISRSASVGTLDADTAELMETLGRVRDPHRRRDHDARGCAPCPSTRTTARIKLIELARNTGHSRFPVLDAEDTVVGTVHVKNAVALPVHERSTTRVKHLMVQADRGTRLPAAGPAAGAAARGRLPARRGPRRVRRARGDRDPRGRDRGDRRRHRRRARPAGRRGPSSRRDGSWLLSGLLRPDEVEDLTGVPLPESEDYDTVAGLVLQVLGRVPRARRHRRGRRRRTSSRRRRQPASGWSR